MKRLILPLMLLTGACAAPPPATPEQRQRDATSAACRDQVERQMRFRERGQTMRVDEAESRLGSGAYMGNPLERSQLGARFERDRLLDECMRGAQDQPGPASPTGGGRGS
ncbi:hypothetical protein [Teichococcus aestuarii]|uniref:hypothetical protein n=1 Tax=Teichococcus aestuarii TaxID=568898 RepID=UPI0011B26F55|nr:hypothetical protein [Pseudoroseomonas aestuarii]